LFLKIWQHKKKNQKKIKKKIKIKKIKVPDFGVVIKNANGMLIYIAVKCIS